MRTGRPEAATLDSVDDVEACGWSDGDIPIPPSGMDATHRLSTLNRRLRLEFLVGAESDSRRRLSRGLTLEELERMLRRHPGDVGADMTRGFRF